MKTFNPYHHDMHTLEHPLKTSFIDAAQSVCTNSEPVEDLIAKYIVEGEHQDGVGFWDNFDSVLDAVQDFKYFVSFAEDEDSYFEL